MYLLVLLNVKGLVFSGMNNFTSKILVLLVAALLYCSNAYSELYTTSKIAEVEKLFYQDELWVLVDLDNCLFEAKQALGHVNWFYDLVKEKTDQGKSKQEAIAEAYLGWIKTQPVCPVKPLESDFIDLIRNLQHQGVIVMGLTHRQPSVASATIKQAESLGIQFSNSAVWKEEFSPEAAFPTLFSGGIVFVNDNNSKGDVFSSFLAHIQQKPKRVLFVDDIKKNVSELGETLEAMGIEYTGIHYTANTKSDPVYSRELADFQYQFLDRILSNEEAAILMSSSKE